MSNQLPTKQPNWADEDDYDSEEADEEIGLNQEGAQSKKDSSKKSSKPSASAKNEVSISNFISSINHFLKI